MSCAGAAYKSEDFSHTVVSHIMNLYSKKGRGFGTWWHIAGLLFTKEGGCLFITDNHFDAQAVNVHLYKRNVLLVWT